jgi:hypothetical protein
LFIQFNSILIYNNSILIYLHANLTVQEPITQHEQEERNDKTLTNKIQNNVVYNNNNNNNNNNNSNNNA